MWFCGGTVTRFEVSAQDLDDRPLDLEIEACSVDLRRHPEPRAQVSDVVQAVLNLRIHEMDAPNLRFALAVHVFPYYNNIASVLYGSTSRR